MIDLSDEIIFASNPFDQFIEDVKRVKEIVNELGEKEMSIVLNMGFWPDEKKTREIENNKNIKVIGAIPHDSKIQASLISRIPLMEFSPRCISAECFRSIASKICEEEYKESFKLKIFKEVQKVIAYFSKFL